MQSGKPANRVPLAERLDRIGALDLEPIKFKLVHEYEWTVADADQVEGEYKRFLMLALKNQECRRVESVVPTKPVDEFWHAHILDTAKYAADSEYCFGFFLHHFPYLGLRGEQDAQDLRDRFSATRRYYEDEFGKSECELAEATVCTVCGTADCAPVPSCSGEPPPTFNGLDRTRPVLVRAELWGAGMSGALVPAMEDHP